VARKNNYGDPNIGEILVGGSEKPWVVERYCYFGLPPAAADVMRRCRWLYPQGYTMG
jgi:hypothetical protein